MDGDGLLCISNIHYDHEEQFAYYKAPKLTLNETQFEFLFMNSNYCF